MKEKGKCSCTAFHKNYTCKHLIGFAKRLHFVFIPNVAKNVPIGKKRPRGRPVQVNKALKYQPDQAPVQVSLSNATSLTNTGTVTTAPATTSLKRPAISDSVFPAKRRRGRPPKNQEP